MLSFVSHFLTVYYYNLIQAMQIQQSLQLPSFALYPVTTQDLKTCYESQNYKLLCSLQGPYYDKKITQLNPYFNISISGSIKQFTTQQLIHFSKKVQQILNVMIVQAKYQRMVFDVNFEIIQSDTKSPKKFIVAPLVNLLSYTCMVKCLEIHSAFACSAGIFRKDKVFWDSSSTQEKDLQKQPQNILVLASDQRDKKPILLMFQGQFNYLYYQKLASTLYQANQQLCKYQLDKVNEVYELFHQ